MKSSSCRLHPTEEMVSTLGSRTFKLEKLCVMELLALDPDLVRSSIVKKCYLSELNSIYFIMRQYLKRKVSLKLSQEICGPH